MEERTMTRIGWISAPITATTGYGVVSRDICFRLADMGYEVVNIGGRGASVVWGEKTEILTEQGNRVLVLPAWGQTGDKATVDYYTERYKLDVIISLFDAFVLNFGKPRKKWIAYIPVDAPVTRKWANYLVSSDYVVAMSNYGFRELLNHFPFFMLREIPHGVDTKVFRPRTFEEKMELRAKWGIPRDKFVFLFVGANMGERKCIPQLMIVFKKFLAKHDDAILYLHTTLRGVAPNSYDLMEFADELGIGDHVMGPKFNLTLDSLETEQLAELYAMADVGVWPSFGEGFNMPLLECMACGTPVIATYSSSMIELVRGHGWLVDTISEDEWVDVPVWIPLLARYAVPSLKDLLARMEEAYENHELRQAYALATRDFALNYDWGKVMPKWDALIQEAMKEQF